MYKGVDLPLFAIGGGLFTAVAFIVIVVLNPGVAAFGVAWLCIGVVVYTGLPAPPGPGPHLDAQGGDRPAGGRPRGGVRLGARAAGRRPLRRVRGGHRGQARGAPAARDPRDRAWSPSRARWPSTRRWPRPRRGADSLIEQARVQAGARVSGHVERVRSGQAGRRIIEEALDMRAAAIVMPLPRRDRRRVAVRQDAGDRAGRAPVPGDHRVDAAAGVRRRKRAAGAQEGSAYEDVRAPGPDAARRASR